VVAANKMGVSSFMNGSVNGSLQSVDTFCCHAAIVRRKAGGVNSVFAWFAWFAVQNLF
jgi:hypothetical protein